MSQDLGRDVPDLEKLYAGKLWADFSHPIITVTRFEVFRINWVMFSWQMVLRADFVLAGDLNRLTKGNFVAKVTFGVSPKVTLKVTPKVTSLSFLSLFFSEKGTENHQKNKDFLSLPNP